MAIITERTTDELKVILNGTIAQYDSLTDKTGTVFFDRYNKAVYVEGILASSNVRDITYEGTVLTITLIDGSSIPIEMSVVEGLAALRTALENWSNARFVRFDSTLTGTEGLTDDQKKNARENIGAVKAEADKGLSTEDFTTALKQKLDGLNNYDDTALKNAINSLQEQLNTLVNADADKAIDTFNEIISFLEGVENTDTLEGILAGIQQRIATLEGKSNVNSLNGLTGNVTIEGKETYIDDIDDDGSGEIGFKPFKVAKTASAITLGIDREGALGILAMALQKAADTSLDGWVRFDNIDVHFSPTSGDSEAHVTLSSTPKVWKFKD
jgi:hypothetical protein